MGKLADLIAAQATPVGPQCRTCQFAAALGDEDRADLEAALADPAIPSSVIHRALKEIGYPGDDSGLRRHRNGGCRGGRTS